MPDLASLSTLLAPLLPDLMGVALKDVSPERVLAEMTVRPDLCTTGGMLHGGAIMAFADTLGAVGTSMNLPEGARTTTVASSTKFVRGAPAGAKVVGESTAFHRGRTTMVWQTMARTEPFPSNQWSEDPWAYMDPSRLQERRS